MKDEPIYVVSWHIDNENYQKAYDRRTAQQKVQNVATEEQYRTLSRALLNEGHVSNPVDCINYVKKVQPDAPEYECIKADT